MRLSADTRDLRLTPHSENHCEHNNEPYTLKQCIEIHTVVKNIEIHSKMKIQSENPRAEAFIEAENLHILKYIEKLYTTFHTCMYSNIIFVQL